MAVYKYSDLCKKYNDFKVPCINILIDGKKIQTALAVENKKNSAWMISRLRIDLSVEKSSMAKIWVRDVYDYTNRTMQEIASIGSSIEIKLGYASESESTFFGYISEIEYEFNNGFYAVITAFDVINLMEQESGPRYYVSKSYSDIVNEIINKYSSLIKKKKIESMALKKEFVSREEKISDFQFVKRLCTESGKMFYISAGNLFIAEKFDEKPIIELNIYEALRGFKLSRKYQNSKVKVIGFDNENYDNAVTGESAVKISGYKDATSQPQLKTVTVSDITKSGDAAKYAKNICDEMMKSINTGIIKCIGLPEIKTGCVLMVSGVDKSTFDKYKYNIYEVSHMIDGDGFNTVVTVNGWS